MLEEQSRAMSGAARSSNLHRALALMAAQVAQSKPEVARPVLSTGLLAIDRQLPEAGLAAGRLHELSGGASVGFLIRLLGRISGPVLWCVADAEDCRLYGPGLVRGGFDPARLTVATGRSTKDILWAAEEGLKSKAVSAVVVETGTALSLTASRRLHLAAEAGDCFGFVLSQTAGNRTVIPPSAASTRWHIDPLAPVSGDPQTKAVSTWAVCLQRCRGAAVSTASSAISGNGGSFGEWRVDVGERGFLRAMEGTTGNASDCLSVAA